MKLKFGPNQSLFIEEILDKLYLGLFLLFYIKNITFTQFIFSPSLI